MPTIDFQTIAENAGAVVLTQAEFLAYLAGAAANGFPSGILTAKQLNKVVRQSSTISAVVANFIANQTGQDVRDTDANLSTLIAQFTSAVIAAGKSIVIPGAVFAAGVANGNAVRWDAGSSNWAKAIADGTSNDLAIGFADVTNSQVYLFGLAAGLFSGLTPGSRYYLSGSVAGAITVTPPADKIYVGVAKNATDLYVDFDPGPAALATVGIAGESSNYKGVAAGIGNYNYTATADEIILENSANLYITLRAVNLTVNANGTVGAPLSITTGRVASTFYYPWFFYNVANGLTCVLDPSPTTPVAPTGYVSGDYKCRGNGWVRSDASGSTFLLNTLTQGKRTTYTVLTGSNTAALPVMATGAASAWTAIAIGAFVPPTVGQIIIQASMFGAPETVGFAPNNNYSTSFTSSTNPAPILLSGASGQVMGGIFTFDLESTNIYWGNANGVSAVHAYGSIDR